MQGFHNPGARISCVVINVKVKSCPGLINKYLNEFGIEMIDIVNLSHYLWLVRSGERFGLRHVAHTFRTREYFQIYKMQTLPERDL